jgi:hypothetical protein
MYCTHCSAIDAHLSEQMTKSRVPTCSIFVKPWSLVATCQVVANVHLYTQYMPCHLCASHRMSVNVAHVKGNDSDYSLVISRRVSGLHDTFILEKQKGDMCGQSVSFAALSGNTRTCQVHPDKNICPRNQSWKNYDNYSLGSL